jgi:polyisoprenoid-binding protein YceI
MRKILILLALLLASPHLFGQQQAWEASQVNVQFFIRNAGMEVAGVFKTVNGSFVTDQKTNLPVLIRGTVQVRSIDTDISLRDNHLRGKDYFDAATFPEMQMQMVRVTASRIVFDVTIKGKSKRYEMPYQWRQVGEKGNFSVEFELNRRDFGVGGRSMMLADDLRVKVQLILKTA